jgi:hypothetical protein
MLTHRNDPAIHHQVANPSTDNLPTYFPRSTLSGFDINQRIKRLEQENASLRVSIKSQELKHLTRIVELLRVIEEQTREAIQIKKDHIISVEDNRLLEKSNDELRVANLLLQNELKTLKNNFLPQLLHSQFSNYSPAFFTLQNQTIACASDLLNNSNELVNRVPP